MIKALLNFCSPGGMAKVDAEQLILNPSQSPQHKMLPLWLNSPSMLRFYLRTEWIVILKRIAMGRWQFNLSSRIYSAVRISWEKWSSLKVMPMIFTGKE